MISGVRWTRMEYARRSLDLSKSREHRYTIARMLRQQMRVSENLAHA